MKPTGIVRKVDELGRIVIPVELRKNYGIEVADSLEIYADKGRIVLSKHSASCIFCGSDKEVKIHRNKKICIRCCRLLAKKN